jgi:glycosyltransferase involved in cell wall biosynthesis
VKILFVCPYVPTPIRTRPYHFIRTLAQRGHQLTLATVWESDWERQQLRELEKQGLEVLTARLSRPRSAANMLGAWLKRLPLQSRYCWVPALARRLGPALQARPVAFDVVHVEHLRGAEYGLALRQAEAARRSPPIVWDSVDCISMLFEQAVQHSRSRFGRWAARLELPATRRYEAWAVGQFDQVLVTSQVDRAALDGLVGAARPLGQGTPAAPPQRKAIRVVPNGVDLARFSPPAGPREPETVVLSGKMSYHANVTAAHQLISHIMPRVWARRPNVKVNIVGSSPAPEVRALARQHAPRVSVTGYVPDVLPYLQGATAAVAPMAYGAGIQNKVLEAMACGTPVVASPQAVAAFEAPIRDALLIADGAQASAEAILSVLADPALQAGLGGRGRAYVEQRYSWQVVTGELESIYDGLLF